MKNVKIIRLQTGEDIIGDVSESQGLVTIKKPFTIIPMQAQQEKQYNWFNSWMLIQMIENLLLMIVKS